MELLDNAFEIASASLRYGLGATREVGLDLKDLGLRRVLILTDPNLANLQPIHTVCESLNSSRIDYDVFDKVRIEPSDQSLKDAIDVAARERYEGFVAVGGGSTIDTAKAANLYSTYPADLLTYVNAPLGGGQPVPGPLKPLIAIPTTAGTGSETTGVAIFDMEATKAKTGIAHRRLKPTLGIVDPENTKTLPPFVTASTGLDVLCHALESYTALPYDQRKRPERPALRPAYQGSNPISDIWAIKTISMVNRYLIRAFRDTNDIEARSQMLLASCYAGMGFGNAGVHLCHGMSYPVSHASRNYQPSGYPTGRSLVPHGISVILNAPAVFRFTADSCSDRHLHAARLLGVPTDDATSEQAGDLLATQILSLMSELGVPNGLKGVGVTQSDIPNLVEGTLPQHRVIKLSPKPIEGKDLTKLFEASMTLWPEDER